MAGQSPCVGCGSEFISCVDESLFMNVTRAPAATVIRCGFTPADVMVIVVVATGGVLLGGVGVLGLPLLPPPLLPPPHPASSRSVSSALYRTVIRCLAFTER